jgi:hypothetical protein
MKPTFTKIAFFIATLSLNVYSNNLFAATHDCDAYADGAIVDLSTLSDHLEMQVKTAEEGIKSINQDIKDLESGAVDESDGIKYLKRATQLKTFTKIVMALNPVSSLRVEILNAIANSVDEAEKSSNTNLSANTALNSEAKNTKRCSGRCQC